MSHYNKGSSFERSLKKKLEAQGFYVIRSAGSGVDGLSPDLIVLSTTKKFAIECKAVESEYLAIDSSKMERMHQFELATGLPVYVAWKHNYKEPVLVPLSMFERQEKSFTIKSANANFGMTLDQISGKTPANPRN